MSQQLGPGSGPAADPPTSTGVAQPADPVGSPPVPGPARMLALVAAALSLVVYLLGFFGEVSVTSSFGGVLLISGGLLAGTAVLPRVERVLVPAAVLVVTGMLLTLQLVTGLSGPSIVVVALVLAVLQSAAVVGALLLDLGLLAAPARGPRRPRYPLGYGEYPPAQGGGPGPGYGPSGQGPVGYGPAGYGPGGYGAAGYGPAGYDATSGYGGPPGGPIAIGAGPAGAGPGAPGSGVPGQYGTPGSDVARPPGQDAPADERADSRSVDSDQPVGGPAEGHPSTHPWASGAPASADPTMAIPVVDPRNPPPQPADPATGAGRHGQPEPWSAPRSEPPSDAQPDPRLPPGSRPDVRSILRPTSTSESPSGSHSTGRTGSESGTRSEPWAAPQSPPAPGEQSGTWRGSGSDPRPESGSRSEPPDPRPEPESDSEQTQTFPSGQHLFPPAERPPR